MSLGSTAVPTAAPTQAQNSLYIGETRISGDDWATAIATDIEAVIEAAEEFLRNALPDSNVTVTNVAVLAGSLIISYEAVSKYTASGLEGLIRQAPLTNLQTSYQNLTGSTGSLTLLSTGSQQQADPAKACNTVCVAMVVTGVIVSIIIIAIIVIVCKKKPNNNNNNDLSKQPHQNDLSAPAPPPMSPPTAGGQGRGVTAAAKKEPTAAEDSPVRLFPEGPDWEFDESAQLYWSPSQELFFDPTSGHFYDWATDCWYDPNEKRWYEQGEQSRVPRNTVSAQQYETPIQVVTSNPMPMFFRV